MEEMRTINLDKYDYRLILNALNEFRNIKIQENVDIEIIDRLMSKLLKAPINKKMLSLNRHTKGKYISNAVLTWISTECLCALATVKASVNARRSWPSMGP